jgi:hypothetical protein
MIQLVPYIVVFALLATAVAWQDVSSRRVDAEAAFGGTRVAAHEVPAAAAGSALPSGEHVIAKLAATDVKPFSLLGVTWKSGMPTDAEINVRWRGAKGVWSPWTDIHQQLVPMEDIDGRPGTEPQWVDWADKVAVRVTSATPAKPVGLKVATVMPDRSSATTPVAVAQPAIILRSQWGASSQSECSQPIYGTTTMGAVIHHTAGSNSYSASESASIVRAIQAYHMKSRSWCDIGYNFLVDRYGQIFEGRAGGIDKPVRAAHSGNAAVNELTMGVSLMGTFESAPLTDAMKTSTTNLVAWRFSRYGIPATGSYPIGGKTLQRIDGHRSVVSTACPGAQAWSWLGAAGGLRDRVAAAVGRVSIRITTTPTGVYTAGVGRKWVSIGWNPVAAAKRYEVRLSRKPTFTRVVAKRTVRKPRAQLTDLRRGTTYYAQVRTIRKNGKTSKWSATVVTSTRP